MLLGGPDGCRRRGVCKLALVGPTGLQLGHRHCSPENTHRGSYMWRSNAHQHPRCLQMLSGCKAIPAHCLPLTSRSTPACRMERACQPTPSWHPCKPCWQRMPRWGAPPPREARAPCPQPAAPPAAGCSPWRTLPQGRCPPVGTAPPQAPPAGGMLTPSSTAAAWTTTAPRCAGPLKRRAAVGKGNAQHCGLHQGSLDSSSAKVGW